jgi:hypothetical protein
MIDASKLPLSCSNCGGKITLTQEQFDDPKFMVCVRPAGIRWGHPKKFVLRLSLRSKRGWHAI